MSQWANAFNGGINSGANLGRGIVGLGLGLRNARERGVQQEFQNDLATRRMNMMEQQFGQRAEQLQLEQATEDAERAAYTHQFAKRYLPNLNELGPGMMGPGASPEAEAQLNSPDMQVFQHFQGMSSDGMRSFLQNRETFEHQQALKNYQAEQALAREMGTMQSIEAVRQQNPALADWMESEFRATGKLSSGTMTDARQTATAQGGGMDMRPHLAALDNEIKQKQVIIQRIEAQLDDDLRMMEPGASQGIQNQLQHHRSELAELQAIRGAMQSGITPGSYSPEDIGFQNFMGYDPNMGPQAGPQAAQPGQPATVPPAAPATAQPAPPVPPAPAQPAAVGTNDPGARRGQALAWIAEQTGQQQQQQQQPNAYQQQLQDDHSVIDMQNREVELMMRIREDHPEMPLDEVNELVGMLLKYQGG